MVVGIGTKQESVNLNHSELANEFDNTVLDHSALSSEFDASNKSIADRAIGALPLGSDFSEGYQRAIGRSTTRMSEGVKDIREKGFSPSNVGSTALGALEYVASPFEGVGTFLGNPIRRAGEGVPGVEMAAQTAELAPLMLAPMPGAQTMKGIGAGAGAVMGEAPAVMAALENAIPVFKSMIGLGGKAAPEAAVSTPRSDMLQPGETMRTSHTPFPTGWYEKQFRGGDEVPALPPPGIHESQPKTTTILGPKTAVGAKGAKQPVLKEDYRNQSERPTLRTGHLPRTGDAPADESYFTDAFNDEFQGRNVPTDVPMAMAAGRDPRINEFYMPNVRESTQLNPELEQQIKDTYFRKRQTSPMREQTGGGEPWGLMREQPTDPLDDVYASFFKGTPETGGGAPTFPVGPRPSSAPNESDDALNNVYQGFFRTRERPALSTSYRQEGLEAGPLPAAPKPTPTPLPKEKPMRGAQSALDDPTMTDLTQSRPELYHNWDDKNPALFGRPPMDDPLPPVPTRPISPPSGAASDKATLATKLKSFKGGPVTPAEVPPSAGLGIKVGDEAEIVHTVGGQEMRAPGGRVVEIIEKQEPKFNRSVGRDAEGNLGNRVEYENKPYAKLEDGREVPVSLLKPLQAEALPKPKTRVTSKAVKAAAPDPSAYAISPEEKTLA